MTKRNVLIASIIFVVFAYILSNPILFGFCRNTYTFKDYIGCFDDFPKLMSFLLINASVAILPFSIITYKMKEEIFQSWWSFARWFVPVIIAVAFFFENAGGGGGFLGPDQSFMAFTLGLLYVIFVFVSIIKIVLAYRRVR